MLPSHKGQMEDCFQSPKLTSLINSASGASVQQIKRATVAQPWLDGGFGGCGLSQGRVAGMSPTRRLAAIATFALNAAV